MRYQRFSHYDTANGKAIGTVLWVSGCEHHCEGCHNASTWDASSGMEWDEAAESHLMATLEYPYVRRLTFSGGDPLATYNRDTVTEIARKVRQEFPDKKIWVYTGYRFEDVQELPIMNLIDVLVDGRFVKEQKDISLPFCGSRNQRVIDVPKTLETGKVSILSI